MGGDVRGKTQAAACWGDAVGGGARANASWVSGHLPIAGLNSVALTSATTNDYSQG